jgi:hypothetical protein
VIDQIWRNKFIDELSYVPPEFQTFEQENIDESYEE